MTEERLYAQLGRLYMAFVLRGEDNDRLAKALSDANDLVERLKSAESDG